MASNASDVALATGLRTYEDYKAEAAKGARKTGSELGKNEFLQLLSAQMQYQDPLEPAKDTEFIAQLAQFSSLESLESLNKTVTNSQYYSLAGKYVSTEMTLDGKKGTLVGVVDSVFTQSGKSYSELGGCMFIDENNNATPLKGNYVVESSSINQVYDNTLFAPDDTGKGVTLLEASQLIGRQVSASIVTEEEVQKKDEAGALVFDEDDNPVMETKKNTNTVNGHVTGVALKDNDIVLTIDDGSPEGLTVSIGSIVDIRESNS